jgi:hypothetical protein
MHTIARTTREQEITIVEQDQRFRQYQKEIGLLREQKAEVERELYV